MEEILTDDEIAALYDKFRFERRGFLGCGIGNALSLILHKPREERTVQLLIDTLRLVGPVNKTEENIAIAKNIIEKEKIKAKFQTKTEKAIFEIKEQINSEPREYIREPLIEFLKTVNGSMEFHAFCKAILHFHNTLENNDCRFVFRMLAEKYCLWDSGELYREIKTKCPNKKFRPEMGLHGRLFHLMNDVKLSKIECKIIENLTEIIHFPNKNGALILFIIKSIAENFDNISPEIKEELRQAAISKITTHGTNPEPLYDILLGLYMTNPEEKQVRKLFKKIQNKDFFNRKLISSIQKLENKYVGSTSISSSSASTCDSDSVSAGFVEATLVIDKYPEYLNEIDVGQFIIDQCSEIPNTVTVNQQAHIIAVRMSSRASAANALAMLDGLEVDGVHLKVTLEE